MAGELDRMTELVKAHEEYELLLSAELDELIPGAVVHGWASKRIEQGKEAREKISLLKISIPNPPQK